MITKLPLWWHFEEIPSHVDHNDVSRMSKSENSTEDIRAKGAVPGLSRMTAEYKTCKVDERVPQIHSIKLKPVRIFLILNLNLKFRFMAAILIFHSDVTNYLYHQDDKRKAQKL